MMFGREENGGESERKRAVVDCPVSAGGHGIVLGESGLWKKRQITQTGNI